MKRSSQLPRDLAAVCRKKILRRVLPCLALELLLVGGLTLFRERLLPPQRPAAAWVLYALALLLPLWITGIPRKLIDRTYWGEILAIDIEPTLDYGRGPERQQPRILNVFWLTVRTDDGKTLRRKGVATAGRLEHKLDMYHVGDRVFHLYGTSHVVVFPTAAESTLLCPICATLNTTETTTCSDCGHTLVKR